MNKNYYITTPIYYPSAKPHMGHAYSSIISDVFARFKRNDNFKVYWIIFLSFSLLLIGCIAVCIGSVNIPILELIVIIYDKIFGNLNPNSNFDVIIFKIRIP